MAQSPRVLNYVLAYLLWAASLLLGVFSLYSVREAYLLALVFSAYNRRGISAGEILDQALQARAADIWSIFILGLLMVVLVVYLEHFYRTAVPAGSLGVRFALVSAIELGVLLLANAVYFLIEGQIRPVFGKVLYVLTFEALLVALFVWLWIYFRRKMSPAV
jgi:hypothetical protein